MEILKYKDADQYDVDLNNINGGIQVCIETIKKMGGSMKVKNEEISKEEFIKFIEEINIHILKKIEELKFGGNGFESKGAYHESWDEAYWTFEYRKNNEYKKI